MLHSMQVERDDIPQLKMFTAFQRQLRLGLTNCAFQSQNNLLRGLGFFVEYRFRLTTVSRLLAIISALSLCD